MVNRNTALVSSSEVKYTAKTYSSLSDGCSILVTCMPFLELRDCQHLTFSVITSNKRRRSDSHHDMSGSEVSGEANSASVDSNGNENDNNHFGEEGTNFVDVGSIENSAEVTSPVRSVEIRTLPSSSLQQTRTPSSFTDNDRMIESWIQQSLTIPSATMDSETVEGVASSFADATIDIGVASTQNRREGSPGSGHFAEGGVSGPSGVTTLDLVSSISSSNTGHNNIINEPVSHPLYSADFQASWSNHSTSTGDDLLGSFSSSTLLSSPGLVAPEGQSTGPRVSSTSPSREEDVSGISSVIHDAARITNWQTVVDLCETHPEAAAYMGRDGWTALHHACNRRCPFPNVVEALIKAYPDALLVEEFQGWLPLHYACRFKAPKEVVRLLTQMDPEKGRIGVSRLDRKGRSPLYYAIRYDAPAGVVGLLLEVDASAVLEEDQNADSPLAHVWDTWAEKLDGKRTLQRILGSTFQKSWSGFEESNSQHNSNDSMNGRPKPASSEAVIDLSLLEEAQNVRKRLEGQAKVFERWNKVNVLLKAAFGFAVDEDWELVNHGTEEKKDYPMNLSPLPSERKWRILHALSAIKCHYSLFLLAAALHPEQAFEIDKHDLKRIDNTSKPKCCDNPSNMTALHFAASSHASGDVGENVLNHLLSLNPAAAKSLDSEGGTPLHRIAENKYKSDWLYDGVEKLYSAFPDAVRLVDENGRLPLHRAASAITYHDSLDDDVIMTRSTIVRLLQENEDAAHQQDHFGCLPLHLVAEYGRSWDAQVQALYDSNTAAVRARTGINYSNRLPLHLVAANADSDFSLVSKLVELNPRGASQADRKGKLPLHLACESGKSWQVVQSIHEAYPEAVQQPEDGRRGWMALHMAASAENSDNELIENIAQLHPIAATEADGSGSFPLHLACMSGKAWENGLSTLFDANPEAIRCPDKEGLLPLHIVALRCCGEPAAASEPTIIDMQTLRATSSEIDQPSEKELEAARHIGDLFNMLKADPTVLSK